MSYLNKYLTRLKQRNNDSLANAVQNTVNAIIPAYISNFSYAEHVVSLLFGNVQSGKTSHVFGLISATADEGFNIFLLLTTDNTLLQQQTLYRVSSDLPEFCICGELDAEVFRANDMKKPAIIVLKKNASVLKKWKNTLIASKYCEGNALFIVDDEADAASLNTLINKGKESGIYSRLGDIQQVSASSIYMQVTGTPQALLLQSQSSNRRPYFTHYFPPGYGYIGGSLLFPQDIDDSPYIILTENSEAQDLIADDEIAENGLLKALCYHLVSSAEIFLNGGRTCNFLVHPSMTTGQHDIFTEKIASYLNEITALFEEGAALEYFEEAHKNFTTTKPNIKSLSEIVEWIGGVLERDEVKIITLNSKSEYVGSEAYEHGLNIIIGGNTLGRGVTFPKLQTTYYCRVAKNPQADTMWQHARMFGYDREVGLVRIFIPPLLYKLFADINSTNNSIIAQVERKKPEDVNIRYPKNLSPTRKNVLDKKTVLTFVGGVDYFPFAPDNKDVSKIDEMLSNFGDDVYSVNLNIFINILQNIISETDDWQAEHFIGILQTMISEKPGSQGKLIVRRGRDIGKGTGTLLSPNDRAIGKSITDFPVLTMYKIVGNKGKGWNGKPLWIPNIKLHGDDVFYCV